MRGTTTFIAAAAFAGVAFVAGYWAHRPAPSEAAAGHLSRRILYYQDPMHPAYRSDKPGIAPDCGMQLEPVFANAPASGTAEELPPGAVRLTPEKEELIGLRTVSVTAGDGVETIRASGKVAADESKVDRISALADGVVRQVSSVAAGSTVKKDDLLATYFVASRDLYSAMQAFFLATGTLDQNASNVHNSGIINPGKASSRVEEELLKSYGLTSAQIKEMVRTREITRDVEFRSPVDGLVLDRNVAPGAVITKGTEVFRVADLSRVWVLADVFERDADYFRPDTGARVTYEGREYRAVVTGARQFDSAARTFKIRLEMDNPGMKLRPDMFVSVEVSAKQPKGVVVPADSVIDSGDSRVVFVATQPGVYEPRPVRTGAEYEGRIQITSGLQAGEKVVAAGTFLLDSESRLHAATPRVLAQADTPVAAAVLPVAHPLPDNSSPALSDPVCGMPLDGKTAHTASYGGKTYYFCSDDCRGKFQKDPLHYTTKKTNEGGARS